MTVILSVSLPAVTWSRAGWDGFYSPSRRLSIASWVPGTEVSVEVTQVSNTESVSQEFWSRQEVGTVEEGFFQERGWLCAA